MGMVIDGIGTSEAIDSSGELLELKGLDISDLVEGRGVLNTEHRGDDAPGYSWLDIIGRVIYAKKIYERGDCENDRQRMYWDQVKLPYLYVKCELFDDDEDGNHPAAKAAAAMIRHYKRRGLPILIRYSIEGSTLSMEAKTIKAAIARRVAATIKPANKTCASGILQDDWEKAKKKDGSFLGGEGDVLDEDSISKFERPDAMKLGKSYVVACDPEVDEVAETFREAVHRFADLTKALAAGSYNAAPSGLTGGAALQREDLGGDPEKRRLINVCKGALRDHDPAVHGPFKTYLKSLLPEASEEFLDMFDGLSDELRVRADLKAKYLQKKDEEKPAYKKAANHRGTRVAGQSVRTREEQEATYQETLARIRNSGRGGQEAFDFGANLDKPEPQLPPIETWRQPRAKSTIKYGKVEVDPERGILFLGGDAPSTPEEDKKRAAEGKPPRRQKPPEAYRLYSPKDDPTYLDIMTDPKNNEHHDHAMDNWVTVHRLTRQGRLPDEYIAHASLYTLMAPNEGGSIQDLAFALYQDLMSKGFDPRKEYDSDQMSDWEREFGDMATGQYVPQYMHDHFMADASGIWRKPTPQEVEKGTVRAGLYQVQPLSDFVQPGQRPEDARLRSTVGKLSLGDKPQPGKWNTVAMYRPTHMLLADLVKKHGVNANAVINDFLSKKWEQEKGGKLGFGFAIKTARYTGGMLGMGQHVVPDTHFIRHLFGMHLDDPRIGDVKGLFGTDSPEREAALRGIDLWFRKNHPAFEWTRQKMLKRYGEDFGEHATFGAFWHHWTLIPLHEMARGWSAGQADNQGTDHEVFWNAGRNILRKFDLPTDPHDPRLRKHEAFADGGSLPARTAHAQRAMEDRFGPVGASLFFYRFLAPLLLAPSKSDSLYKAEVLTRLMKGEFEQDAPTPTRVLHRGSVVEPGEVEFLAGMKQGERMPLVAMGTPYHHVLGMDGSLMKLMANHPNIRILREPKVVRGSTVVDSKKHGHPTLHGTDEQHDIIHGLDMARRVAPGKKGYAAKEDRNGEVGWYQSREGHMVYVKPQHLAHGGVDAYGWDNDRFNPTHREAAYSRMAHEFFGLGEHVPVSTTFRHPVTNEWHSAQERVEGEHYSPKSHKHRTALGAMARTGTLDKLALMDMILGHGDRHTENGLISPDLRRLHLIDNGLSFAPLGRPGTAFVPAVNEFWAIANKHNDGAQWYTKPLHSAAVAWLQSLNPQKMAEHLDRIGVPKGERNEVVRRLQAVQQRAQKPVSRGAAFFAPFLSRGQKAPGLVDMQDAGFFSSEAPSQARYGSEDM